VDYFDELWNEEMQERWDKTLSLKGLMRSKLK
jgi:hypothetical protein